MQKLKSLFSYFTFLLFLPFSLLVIEPHMLKVTMTPEELRTGVQTKPVHEYS